MAVAGRLLGAAPSPGKAPRPKSKRKPPTETQRNYRTKGYQERKTLGVRGKETRLTSRQKAADQAYVKKFSGEITRENQAHAQQMREQNEVVKSREQGRRVETREQLIEQRIRAGEGIRRGERLRRQFIEEPVTSNTRPVVNTIILVVMVMFLLVVLYAIVTQPTNFTGFLGNFRNGIASFAKTGPLFITNPTTKS